MRIPRVCRFLDEDGWGGERTPEGHHVLTRPAGGCLNPALSRLGLHFVVMVLFDISVRVSLWIDRLES